MVRIADCATAESGTNSSSRLSKASTKYSQLCSGRVRWRFPKPFRCAPTYFALGSSTLRTLPRQSEMMLEPTHRWIHERSTPGHSASRTPPTPPRQSRGGCEPAGPINRGAPSLAESALRTPPRQSRTAAKLAGPVNPERPSLLSPLAVFTHSATAELGTGPSSSLGKASTADSTNSAAAEREAPVREPTGARIAPVPPTGFSPRVPGRQLRSCRARPPLDTHGLRRGRV